MPAPGTSGKMPHSKNTVAGAWAFTAYQRESNAKGTLAAYLSGSIRLTDAFLSAGAMACGVFVSYKLIEWGRALL